MNGTSEKRSTGKNRGNSEKKCIKKNMSGENTPGYHESSAQICYYNGDSGSPSMYAHFNKDNFSETSELASVSPPSNAHISLGGRSGDNSNGLSNEAN